MMFNVLMSAAEGGAVIDQGLVTEIFNLITTASKALFTMFPINVFVIIGIVGAAVGLIKKGRKAAGSK